jgi:hypothetical protein
MICYKMSLAPLITQKCGSDINGSVRVCESILYTHVTRILPDVHADRLVSPRNRQQRGNGVLQ